MSESLFVPEVGPNNLQLLQNGTRYDVVNMKSHSLSIGTDIWRPLMTLNGVIAVILLHFIEFELCRPITSQWLKIDHIVSRISSSVFWPQLTHPAVQTLCDSWAICLHIHESFQISTRRWIPCQSMTIAYHQQCWVNYFLKVIWVWVQFLVRQDAQLSQRDRAAGCVIVFAKSKRLELGDNILRTVQVYLQPLWYNRPENLSNSVKKTQNKGHYGIQDHSRSSRSVPIESPYAISY